MTMRVLPIAEGIQMVSVNAEGFLFEGMWDLPHGVSINSYVVGKEEVVLIDGICGWDQTEEGLHAFLEEAGIELENIKHVVLNHMEPDHTEWITAFLEIYSDVEFYCSKPAYKLLEHSWKNRPDYCRRRGRCTGNWRRPQTNLYQCTGCSLA